MKIPHLRVHKPTIAVVGSALVKTVYSEILESKEASSLKLPSLIEFVLVSKNRSKIKILIDQLFKIALIFTNVYDERTLLLKFSMNTKTSDGKTSPISIQN